MKLNWIEEPQFSGARSGSGAFLWLKQKGIARLGPAASPFAGGNRGGGLLFSRSEFGEVVSSASFAIGNHRRCRDAVGILEKHDSFVSRFVRSMKS